MLPFVGQDFLYFYDQIRVIGVRRRGNNLRAAIDISAVAKPRTIACGGFNFKRVATDDERMNGIGCQRDTALAVFDFFCQANNDAGDLI